MTNSHAVRYDDETDRTEEAHILIVEGVDGGGKTTLVKALTELLPAWELQEKAVRSDQSAMVDVSQYVSHHLRLGFGKRMYDRFAMISAPIYGLCFDMGPNAQFWDSDWLHEMEVKMSLVNPLVVYCLPDWETYLNTVLTTDQPREVVANAKGLYGAYWGRYHHDGPWGRALRYDYTRMTPQRVANWVAKKASVR